MLLTSRDGDGAAELLAALSAVHVCTRGSACGTCEPCTWLAAGQHPEVLWLGGGERVLVEDAATLQEHLELSPTPPSRWRIAAIPDVDRMSVQAANRLLKLLEEPPPQAKILLSTKRPGALLETVLSRCVRWRLKPAAEARACGTEEATEFPGLAALLATDAGAVAKILDEAEKLGRGAGLSLPELLAGLEHELNRSYFELARTTQGAPAGAQARARRRELIRQARQLAQGGSVPLNAQMALEAVALASLRGVGAWTE
jgi:DNA polymerase-3 subunit gamma/tau